MARIERVYGITEGVYAALLDQQGGGCAICHRKPKKLRLAVDHDHETGFVRGLLCMTCNRGLAYFKDTPGRLLIAAAYLDTADEWWESLTLSEQALWRTYRGRATGKERFRRIAKQACLPRHPQTEVA